MTFFYTNVQSFNNRVIFFLLMLLSAPALGSDGSPALHSTKGNFSQDGHIKLEWQQTALAAGAVFEVQQAAHENFINPSTIYRGPDLATFISGLENGVYYYRIRLKGREWSDSLRIEVQHHSLRLTFILLGIGALVFLLTVGVVVKGTIHSKTQEE